MKRFGEDVELENVEEVEDIDAAEGIGDIVGSAELINDGAEGIENWCVVEYAVEILEPDEEQEGDRHGEEYKEEEEEAG